MDRTSSQSGPTEWLSAKKAGDLLGVSARTVGRYIRSGHLRGRLTQGGQFRVTREEVERLAAEQESRAVQPHQTTEPHKEDHT